eukprot:TRINITY_DN48509_c0_g1_i1.p1 TRINITY_DN48509_c0_g1~~TRINITY_DN48509_c0_g1_i1.p1  ORF type:complete len:457 (-),score=53.45 TRINITY_DN48509_c0_g1_i1:85-1377(-)
MPRIACAPRLARLAAFAAATDARRPATLACAPRRRGLSSAYPARRRASSTAVETAAAGSCEDETARYVQVPEERLDEFVRHEVAYFASMSVGAMSVRQILDTPPEKLADICMNEGPKRLALRIMLLEGLDGWKEIPELVKMHTKLTRWYKSLRLVQSRSGNLGELITCIKDIRRDGADVIPLVAGGIHKLNQNAPDDSSAETLNRWLDGFFLSRIGTNVLADQLVSRSSVLDGGKALATGIIDPACDASKICASAARIAVRLCRDRLGQEPKVEIENYKSGSMQQCVAPSCIFSYIPSYLLYIMLELLKNSCKATVERAQNIDDIKRRPIRILVCHDDQHVAIMVGDRAGGIPLDVGDRIWSYLYGACARNELATPLAGYGVGLPLSRLYAQYLGGSLHVTSYPGYGTQAHVLLPRIDVNQVELVPTIKR